MSQPIPPDLYGWTVLVVDDEEDSLDVARRLLTRAGAQVYSASNGREALAIIQQQRPDCVLSDLSMPEMDGWLLIQELNHNRPTEAIPVIALTAHAMPGDRQRAIEAGFHNYITKPLDARKFVQQLIAILVDFNDAPHDAGSSYPASFSAS
jgi:CheY-like chemotaxis protein